MTRTTAASRMPRCTSCTCFATRSWSAPRPQRRSLFQMHDAALNRNRRGVCPILGSKFLEQMRHVQFHRGFADLQERADFLVAAAFDDFAQDRSLPGGEILAPQTRGEDRGNFGRK